MHNPIKKLFIFILLALVLVAPAWGQGKEEKEIRKMYEDYDKAVTLKNAEKALEYVTESSVGYFDFALMLAQNASREDLSRLGIMEKIEVLRIRQEYTAEQIAQETGRNLLAKHIEAGLTVREHLPVEDLGAIKVDGELATAEILADGKASGYLLQFQREDGVWKVDLVSLFSMSGSLLDMMLAAQSMTHDQYLQRLIPMTTGRQLKESDWQPVAR